MARTKQTKGKQAKSVETPKVEKPVTPPVSDEVVTQEEVVNETPYVDEFSAVVEALDAQINVLRELKSRVVRLEKTVHREHKGNLKKLRGRRRRPADPSRGPSGFAKPGPVSDELRAFLGLEKDKMIARTEVTKEINAYCRKHNLQLDSDRRKINPDKALTKLLRLKKGDEVSFFNLQKYMKVHFPNKDGVYPTA
tara:strand:- start:4169 stop:4753 length:585 start_codon:yes stop_codon:yes gene_type:complete